MIISIDLKELSTEDRARVAGCNIQKEAYSFLASSGDKAVVREIIKNPNVPAWIVEEIFDNNAATINDEDINRELALCPNATEMLLLELVANDSYVVRQSVAFNENITPKVMEILVSDDTAEVRAELAYNKKIPYKIQQILSKDPVLVVRRRLVLNEKIDKKILAQLAADDEELIRREVIKHKSLSLVNALIMRHDKDITTAMTAKNQTFSFPRAKKGLRPCKGFKRNEIADMIIEAQTSIEPERLLELAQYENYSMRINVAGNKYANSLALTYLASADEEEIRELVAENPNTSTLILGMLSHDEDKTVARNAKRALEKRRDIKGD